MKKLLIGVAWVVILLVLAGVGFVGWKLYPHPVDNALPAHLTAMGSSEGQSRLQGAEARADYTSLVESFRPQATISYCGVATSVSVLNALGMESDQWHFFTEAASAVRSRLDVTFGGMSLVDLAGLIEAHGLQTTVVHAEDVSEDTFRSAIERNLASEGDYLIVNYQREVLGQDRVGHISPLAAFDADTDSVLIMDTAAHKYPPTWVPVAQLFRAMQTTDSATGKSRGYLEVTPIDHSESGG